MKRFIQPARAAIVTALMAGVAVPAYAQLSEAIRVGEQATRKAEQTQERINQLDDQRNEMVREFRTLLQQKDAANLYAMQQERVVASQGAELESLVEQLDRVEEIKAQMVPMMQDMLSALEAFRAADLPFKDTNEQGEDVRSMRYEQIFGNPDADILGVLDRADVSPAEQYRLIIEAFQKEMEYGRTIDTYIDEITTADGAIKTVEIFRYGRVALTYVTNDRQEVGRYNRDTGQWEKLPSSYKSDILTGIRIAKKVATPTVLSAPVSKLAVQSQ